MVKQSKTLKVMISGSYKASDGKLESYDKVVGIIPRLNTTPPPSDPISKAEQMIITRYAHIWLTQAKKRDADGKVLDEAKYRRVSKVRQVFVDSIDDNDENPDAVLSYVGKNIMEMNFEELQDLAAANDLNGIPRYQVGSVQHARRVAWSEYAIKVLGLVEYVDPKAARLQNIYDFRVQGFNPAKHEAIIADGRIRERGKESATIEEGIDQQVTEALTGRKKTSEDATTSRLTLAQLKEIAKTKGVEFHASIGFDQLHKKIYGAAA